MTICFCIASKRVLKNALKLVYSALILVYLTNITPCQQKLRRTVIKIYYRRSNCTTFVADIHNITKPSSSKPNHASPFPILYTYTNPKNHTLLSFSLSLSRSELIFHRREALCTRARPAQHGPLKLFQGRPDR